MGEADRAFFCDEIGLSAAELENLVAQGVV